MFNRRSTPTTRRTVRRRAVVAGVVLLVSLANAAPVFGNPPGILPQTHVEPSFGIPLTQRMRTLIRAITLDSNSIGATIFFPRSANIQMKTGTIPNPSSDYAQRLIVFFDLDLAAYHQRLFAEKLLRVESNPTQAAWIAPGVCENRIGYWYAPRIRLVFRRGGQVSSVAVASLISWRGVWYVVHLGPNPRTVNIGTVDGFERGAGTPGPAGGC